MHVEAMNRILCILVAAFAVVSVSWVQGLEDAEPCRNWDISSCEDHQNCTACVLDLSWAKVNFCVEEEVADKLPDSEWSFISVVKMALKIDPVTK